MTDQNATPASAPAVPRVVDLFHGDVLYSDVRHTDPISDFTALKQAGIYGMIHKATQGIGVADPAFKARTQNARIAGVKPGAYHFNTGDTIQGQLNHFFDVVQPEDDMPMVLDFEDNRLSQMTLAQAVQFLRLGDDMLGRPLWVYSGNRIKELIVNQSDEVVETFAKRPFWLCEYGPIAKMVDGTGKPLPWSHYTLWQFTGDGIGPLPHSLPGILTKGIDINRFVGSQDDFNAIWE